MTTQTITELPGWLIWRTEQGTSGNETWSVMPVGATSAPPGCHGHASRENAIRAARHYEAGLETHITKTRQEIAATPPSWIGRHQMLSARLSALIGLRAIHDGEP